MQPDSETAYAKINLALHVRARRADGYHEIETIFAFLDAGDVLSVLPADELSLRIEGPFADGLSTDNNLILRAARLLQERWDVGQGAVLTLDKRLPIASGIGGGSADAAATARLLNCHWGLGASETELAEILAPLGADIPACVYSQSAIGRGTGTDLQIAVQGHLAGVPCLLVNPRKPISTAAIFGRWDGVDSGELGDGQLLDTALAGRNDLQPMAIDLCPEIAKILRALENCAPVLARMSGSGATCFALFSDIEARDRAAAAVTRDNPFWWTMAGALR